MNCSLPILRSLAALLCACFIAEAGLADTLVLDKNFPIHLEQLRVRVLDEAGEPIANANLSVTYRPGSQVAHTDAVGVSGTDGTIVWTPADAGIATLTATWEGSDSTEQTASTNVSVRFRSLPLDGILIMLVAGFILIVGSAVRMYKVIKSPDFVQ